MRRCLWRGSVGAWIVGCIAYGAFAQKLLTWQQTKIEILDDLPKGAQLIGAETRTGLWSGLW